jgi:hypothetical protein
LIVDVEIIEILLRLNVKTAVTKRLGEHGYESSKSLEPGRLRRENRSAIRNVLAESSSLAAVATRSKTISNGV